jgi:CBS domain-containing protein
MDPPVTVQRSDDVHWAMELVLRHQTRELVIVDEQGNITGVVDESDITRADLGGLEPPRQRESGPFPRVDARFERVITQTLQG